MNLNFISERKSFDNWKGKNNGKGTMGKEKKIVLAVMQKNTFVYAGQEPWKLGNKPCKKYSFFVIQLAPTLNLGQRLSFWLCHE